MECPCGGSTIEATAKNRHYLMSYEKCRACGRIGVESLFDRSTKAVLARGMEARQRYQASEAERLTRQKSSKKGESWTTG